MSVVLDVSPKARPKPSKIKIRKPTLLIIGSENMEGKIVDLIAEEVKKKTGRELDVECYFLPHSSEAGIEITSSEVAQNKRNWEKYFKDNFSSISKDNAYVVIYSMVLPKFLLMGGYAFLHCFSKNWVWDNSTNSLAQQKCFIIGLRKI